MDIHTPTTNAEHRAEYNAVMGEICAHFTAQGYLSDIDFKHCYSLLNEFEALCTEIVWKNNGDMRSDYIQAIVNHTYTQYRQEILGNQIKMDTVCEIALSTGTMLVLDVAKTTDLSKKIESKGDTLVYPPVLLNTYHLIHLIVQMEEFDKQNVEEFDKRDDRYRANIIRAQLSDIIAGKTPVIASKNSITC